ncbi:Hypothetical predicted protein [Olea europaea subsp. europaea]|uniref:Uncharacterized protein n=1 Tax=Olea europaea subsp. europaea TaxID=158383 RepID=A0A8S0TVS4_OLEEU|nr:Hypothetical predicted protein [Olea europaea subsp. europaea]
MASSAVSTAASRMLNISNSSLRSLIHRHLLRPAAVVTSAPHMINNNTSNQEQLLFNPFHSERRSLDLLNPSFDMKNLNTDAGNLPRNLQPAFGFSAHKIEADRRRGPVNGEDSDDYGDSDCDDDDDDNYDNDDDDYYDDDDDDEGPPRRFRE